MTICGEFIEIFPLGYTVTIFIRVSEIKSFLIDRATSKCTRIYMRDNLNFDVSHDANSFLESVRLSQQHVKCNYIM